MSRRSIPRTCSFLTLALALACGGGGGSSDGGGTSASPTRTGVLTDSNVGGVAYTTSSGLSGTTNAGGQFSYHEGDTIKFTLGAITLGNVTAAGILTPIELANGDATKLQNLLVLLQSLDSDGNPSNGITIPAAAAAAVTTGVDLSQAPATFASASNTALQAAMTAGGITTPIVSTTTANASFLAQGMTLLSGQVWAWSSGTTGGALRVLSNGAYLQGQAAPTDNAGTAGLELGTVSIAGFDSYGYWHDPATTTINTNGTWGLSDPRATDRFRFNGDQLLGGDYTQGALSAINKMQNDPAGLVGAWTKDSATSLNTQHFFFFSDGHYLMVDPIGGGGCGLAGVEYGSYAYNASAKLLTFSAIQYDTNGCAGAHDSGTYSSVTITMAADGKSLTGKDATDPSGTVSTFYRVSK